MTNGSGIPAMLREQFDGQRAEGAADTPCLMMCTGVVAANYEFFRNTVSVDEVYFPVKTNNTPAVLRRLAALGARFEIASAGELETLLAMGLRTDRVAFSNPVKMPRQVAQAAHAGVRSFAFDHLGELAKLRQHAPASSVYLRLDVANDGAQWRLQGKFGAAAAEAVPLMLRAQELGLCPSGLAFHVGWNNRSLRTWARAIQDAVEVAEACLTAGVPLQSVNIGGGFPAHGGDPYQALRAIATVLQRPLRRLRQELGLSVYAEPGSFIAANAGVMLCTVVEVIERQGRAWVYVDAGVNQGFYWVYAGVTYQVGTVAAPCGPLRECVVTGPTCDASDVFADRVPLPVGLRSGDQLYVFPAGAYVASARDYNGFGYPEVIVC